MITALSTKTAIESHEYLFPSMGIKERNEKTPDILFLKGHRIGVQAL